jgi:hypothetical protein
MPENTKTTFFTTPSPSTSGSHLLPPFTMGISKSEPRHWTKIGASKSEIGVRP